MTTSHRAIAYCLQDRAISNFGKMEDRNFENRDSITGKSEWCDFSAGDEWGEVIICYPAGLPIQDLWNIVDIDGPQFENKYGIQIDQATRSQTSPNNKILPSFKIDIPEEIRKSLEKKLLKKYPYFERGYKEKGTLIIGVFDPLFSGFTTDRQINSNLSILREYTKKFIGKSCFKRIILVNLLEQFYQNPMQHTYELYPILT